MNKIHIYTTLIAIGVAIGAVAFLVGRAWAGGIPTVGALTYSGLLEDAAGAPISGEHPIQIKLWNVEKPELGKDSLCDEQSIPERYPVVAGRFSVQLSERCTEAIKNNSDVWVEVKVDGSSVGITKLSAVPYAIDAAHATSADSATNATGPLAQQIVPAGAIMAFDLDACPSGWTLLTSAQGRTIVGTNPGGNGLSQRKRGDLFGEETHTLTVNEMPSHTHEQGDQKAFTSSTISSPVSTSGTSYRVGNFDIDNDAYPRPLTKATGNNQPANQMQPSIAFLYCRKL